VALFLFFGHKCKNAFQKRQKKEYFVTKNIFSLRNKYNYFHSWLREEGLTLTYMILFVYFLLRYFLIFLYLHNGSITNIKCQIAILYMYIFFLLSLIPPPISIYLDLYFVRTDAINIYGAF
jgi:hypothetical protein